MSDIEGLHFVKYPRPGKPLRWYVYAWRGGPLVLKADSPTRPKIGAGELEQLLGALDRHRGTLTGLIREWRPNSPEWQALAASTQSTWGYYLDAIEARWGETPLSFWSDPRMVEKVVKWRDSKAATPRAADNGILVLRELLSFGRLRGRVTLNVADGIPNLYHGGDREEIIWTEEDYERFDWHANKLELPQIVDGRDLAGESGLRRADLVTVDEQHIYDAVIIKKALKRSKRKRHNVVLPRLPTLDALIERLRGRKRVEGVTTLLVNSHGRPWTGGGFTGMFNRVRDAADIVHVDQDTGDRRKKHLHDLRGTFCTKLLIAAIEAGAPLSDEEAADIMAWSPARIARIRKLYVPQARIVTAISERIRRGL